MSRLQELGGRIESCEARIGVVGARLCGAPLVVEFARAGYRVTGFELDVEKVRMLSAGDSYIEDVPASEVAKYRASGHLTATTDFGVLSAMDVINVCVPTPLTKTK